MNTTSIEAVLAVATDVAAEYVAARNSGALFVRTDRGLLRIGGKDRKAWLHNLVTNAVKTLADDAGCYAFACDVRGRVQFDMNVLSTTECVWLDVAANVAEAAAAHLNRFLITEDVTIENFSDRYARLAVCGPAVGLVARRLGVADLAALPALASCAVTPEGLPALRLFRHDFAGLPGFELIVGPDESQRVGSFLLRSAEIRPASLATLDVLRIEAGIPWFGRDIDERTLPPETGQVARGISYHKGCYLGQEIIERMRSHGSLARRLVRLEVAGGGVIPCPAALRKGDAEVGRTTSMVVHPTTPTLVGLGYLRTSVQELSDIVVGDPPRAAAVLDLP